MINALPTENKKMFINALAHYFIYRETRARTEKIKVNSLTTHLQLSPDKNKNWLLF